MTLFRWLIAAFALLAVTPASAASLLGETIDVSYRLPDSATTYPFATPSAPSFVVAPGVESVVDVEGVTSISVDFGASSLAIDFATVLGNPTWNSTAFNGLLFQGTGAAKIIGANVVSSTMAGFDNSRIQLSNGTLGLNWAGLSYVDGTNITLDLSVAGVPEPSTWAMMLMGFAVLGMAVRRRRRATLAFA